MPAAPDFDMTPFSKQTTAQTTSLPTLVSELRRGFNAFNMGVGLVSAVALALLVYALTLNDIIPIVITRGGAALQAYEAGLILFSIITALHVVMHAYFGWRFERGIAALKAGDKIGALRLLGIAEKPGMEHYDENGQVRAALKTLKQPSSSPLCDPPRFAP